MSTDRVLVRSHGAWGLPSFEPASLEAMCYAALANVPFKDYVNLYSHTPLTNDGLLPVLVDGSKVISRHHVIPYLQAVRYPPFLETFSP